MRSRRSKFHAIALAVVAASFAMTGSLPASAGAGTAVLYGVNGIPGAKVDVCVSGEGEVASNMDYARHFKARLDSGSVTIKVRKASKGKCKGDLLAKSSLNLADGDNVTAVARRIDGDPRITTFANNVNPTDGGEIRITAAHMMKAGTLDMLVDGDVMAVGLARGKRATFSLTAGDIYAIWGAKSGNTTPIVGPRVIENTPEGSAFTLVMVGTKVENNRFVAFRQAVGTGPA